MSIEHESKIQLVHFLVKKVHMCAYLKNIKKVLPLVALENLPGAPSYLAGLMNLQGKNIPVIDLAIRLNMARHKKFSLDMPILLCSNGLEEVAVIVDNILGLTEFNQTDLQKDKDFDKPDSPYLATLTHDSDSSLLINIDYLVKIDLIKDIKDDNTYASRI